MKRVLLASIILVSHMTMACANELTCGIVADKIANLEHFIRTADVDEKTGRDLEKTLNDRYKSYYKTCTQEELEQHFKGNYKPKTKKETK